MAEEQEEDEVLSAEEKEELEALLENDDGEDVAAAGLKGKFKKIFANKKILVIFVGLLLVIIIGITIFLLKSGKEAELDPSLLDQTMNQLKEKVEEEEEEEEVKIAKVNIYKLEPFFLPLLDDGKETGQFISISANLLMSNSVLGREIDKVLPLMRKNIYNIIRRKQTADFNLKRSRAEEIIKKEILNASNALLLSGAGTINDVFFTRFMIK